MKKTLLAILMCIVLVLSFAACGASSDKISAYVNNGAAEAEDFFYSADQETGNIELGNGSLTEDSATSGKSNSTVEEKIVKTVDLSVQTKEYDAYVSALTSSVSKLGGYVENSTSNMGSYYSVNSNRSSRLVVRIPSAKLDEFISGAEVKGKITSKTETQENVTLKYVDLESRINAYKTEQKTLTGLLEKAESLADVLQIQERLSEVNYQLETYTAQLRVLENRVSYSTVTINIDEVERVVEEEPSLGTEIKNRFLDTLEDLGDWLRDFVVDFIGGLPVIIPVVALAVTAILIIRMLIRKRRNKKNK